MKPYYETELGKLYHGDSLKILKSFPDNSFDAIITDPVWPNVPKGLLNGSDDPLKLFKAVARHFPRLSARAVIQLGCDSDPRFLKVMPSSLLYLRTCWLKYCVPGYKGRLLNTGDVAYLFGSWPKSRPGRRVLPGEVTNTESKSIRLGNNHPCPRRLSHVLWLVGWFADGPVLDPFMGSGTTAVAAERYGLPWVGIEIEERFCEIAANRIERERSQIRLSI